MNNIITRIKDRSYLVTTAVLYAVMTWLFSVSPFGVTQSFPINLVISVNGYAWALLFFFAVVTCVIASVANTGVWQKLALWVSAAVAFGMTMVFAYVAICGQVEAIVPTVVWTFITATHIIMTGYYDPYILRVIEEDVRKIKQDIEEIKRARD